MRAVALSLGLCLPALLSYLPIPHQTRPLLAKGENPGPHTTAAAPNHCAYRRDTIPTPTPRDFTRRTPRRRLLLRVAFHRARQQPASIVVVVVNRPQRDSSANQQLHSRTPTPVLHSTSNFTLPVSLLTSLHLCLCASRAACEWRSQQHAQPAAQTSARQPTRIDRNTTTTPLRLNRCDDLGRVSPPDTRC